MANNKYSGHSNLQGQGYKERAQLMGIRTLIG